MWIEIPDSDGRKWINLANASMIQRLGDPGGYFYSILLPKSSESVSDPVIMKKIEQYLSEHRY